MSMFLKKDNIMRIVHHVYHICMVYPHRPSNNQYVRIVHHRCHIYMLCTQCGPRFGVKYSEIYLNTNTLEGIKYK